MRTLKGKLSLLFDRDRGLSIEIEDTSSHHTVSINLPAKDVAALLGRQVLMDCDVTWPEDLSKIGMRRENKSVELIKTWEDFKPSRDLIEKVCEEQGYLVDGWELWQDGTTTQQKKRGYHKVVLDRYVEVDNEED